VTVFGFIRDCLRLTRDCMNRDRIRLTGLFWIDYRECLELTSECLD